MAGSTASAANGERPELGEDQDYDALWEQLYRRARRQGMSLEMARYAASREVHHRQLEDRGLKPFAAGDLELIY
jgi:hypothetical protein